MTEPDDEPRDPEAKLSPEPEPTAEASTSPLEPSSSEPSASEPDAPSSAADPSPRAAASGPRGDAPSARWPWLRSVAYSLMVALSPAVWVIDTSSCSAEGDEPLRTTYTGIELARGVATGGSERFLVLGALLLVVLAPWLAWRARGPLARLGFHVLGLLGALFGLLGTGFLVYFTLFHIREVQPVGYLALMLGAVPVIESFARIALGVTELRAHRARAGPRPA